MNTIITNSTVNFDKFITCKTFKTAIKTLHKELENIGYKDAFHVSDIQWQVDTNFNMINEDEYYDYWKDGNMFFRLNIIKVYDNRFYIDCGFDKSCISN